MTIEQKLLSAKQVAVILNVSKGSVYRLMASGQIPHVAVGARKMIALDTLKKLLASGGVAVTPLSPPPAPEPPKRQPVAKRRPQSHPEAVAALLAAAEAVQAAAASLQLH